MKAKPTGTAQDDRFDDDEDGFMEKEAISAEIQEKTPPPELRRVDRKFG